MDLNLNLLGGEVGEFYLSPKMICEWFSGTGDSKDLKSIQAWAPCSNIWKSDMWRKLQHATTTLATAFQHDCHVQTSQLNSSASSNSNRSRKSLASGESEEDEEEDDVEEELAAVAAAVAGTAAAWLDPSPDTSACMVRPLACMVRPLGMRRTMVWRWPML